MKKYGSAQMKKTNYLSILFFFSLLLTIGCNGSKEMVKSDSVNELKNKQTQMVKEKIEGVDYFLPNIDLNNWKVTLPVGNPSKVEPPEILNYATNPNLKKYMYNDSINGALVFFTEPGSTTRNSSYSRTELREQMVPGSDKTNWTFAEGGRMKGTLSVPDVSKGEDGKFHKVIIMQIHGRLTNEQRDLIGEDDNNAPPVLKIYWDKGKVRVKTKILKDKKVDDVAILHTKAWTDDKGHNFKELVHHDKFTLEVIVSDSKLTVTLNDKETVTYDSPDLKRYGVFENYFKAGNYLNTKDSHAYSYVNYYDLEIEH